MVWKYESTEAKISSLVFGLLRPTIVLSMNMVVSTFLSLEKEKLQQAAKMMETNLERTKFRH